MRGNICIAIIASLVLGLASGCVMIGVGVNLNSEQHESGAGVEAVGGGAAGKRKTVFGGLIGSLSGGFLGDYSYRKEKGLQETREIHLDDPEIADIKVRIEAVRSTPGIADPGDTIDIRIKYAVLTPQEDMTVIVHEIREILFEENLVGEATVNIEREGGTWRSSVPITLPGDAGPGIYRVVVSIRTPNGEQDTEEVTFRVR